MTSLPSRTLPLLKACITCGTPTPNSRCPRHTSYPSTTTPARARYKDQHGYAHQQRRRRMLKAGATCAMAYMGGCHGPLQLDYIVPLSLHGQATDENAQILCERHNIAKGGRNRLKR